MKKKIVIGICIAIILILGITVIAVKSIIELIVPDDWNQELGMIVTDEGKKIPLPKGFEKLDITNKINEGIVIEDESGNQFVWVPVYEELTRSDFGKTDTPLGKGIKVSYEKEEGAYWEDTDNEEYIKMAKSVEKYKGFYVGRYEASYVSGETEEDYIPASKESTSNSLRRIKKEPGMLWNFVTHNEAVAACKNMYKNNSTIQGFLMYGGNWDTILQWYLDTGVKVLEEIASDSSTWGHHRESGFANPGEIELGNSGQYEETKVNNIYDLAGNLWEFTQEKFGDTDNTVHRGGGFRDWDSDNPEAILKYPVCHRGGTFRKDQPKDSAGFRVSLYIK